LEAEGRLDKDHFKVIVEERVCNEESKNGAASL
jgi:hypothetical protein